MFSWISGKDKGEFENTLIETKATMDTETTHVKVLEKHYEGKITINYDLPKDIEDVFLEMETTEPSPKNILLSFFSNSKKNLINKILSELSLFIDQVNYLENLVKSGTLKYNVPKRDNLFLGLKDLHMTPGNFSDSFENNCKIQLVWLIDFPEGKIFNPPYTNKKIIEKHEKLTKKRDYIASLMYYIREKHYDYIKVSEQHNNWNLEFFRDFCYLSNLLTNYIAEYLSFHKNLHFYPKQKSIFKNYAKTHTESTMMTKFNFSTNIKSTVRR